VPKPAPEIDPAHRWDPPPEEKPPDWYQKLNDGQKWQVLKDALDEAAKTGKYEQVPRWMKTPIGWASPWPTRSVPDDWID
jgi:hypothetical protein